MAKRTERISMRITAAEKAMLRQLLSETTLDTLADYIRSMTFNYRVESRLSTEEKQLFGNIKNGLHDLKRLRNLLHKDARAELLDNLDEVLNRIKKMLDDREM